MFAQSHQLSGSANPRNGSLWIRVFASLETHQIAVIRAQNAEYTFAADLKVYEISRDYKLPLRRGSARTEPSHETSALRDNPILRLTYLFQVRYD